MNPRGNYQVEVSRDSVLLNRENVGHRELIARSGLCAAVPGLSLPSDHEHFPGYNSIPSRTMEQYHREVLTPLIKAGVISDGSNSPFDDRKLRYSGSRIVGSNNLEIHLGNTHFQAVRADLNRSPEENLALQDRGLREFNDRYVFFARSLGVTVLPINEDGTIFIGERTNRELGGFLNGAAGYLDYKDNTKIFNPKRDATRELQEELGVDPEQVQQLNFVGLFSNPVEGNIDFTYIARVAKNETYFSSGDWKKNVKEREHKNLVRIATIAEIKELLEAGKVPGQDKRYNVMPGTIWALLSIRPEEIRN